MLDSRELVRSPRCKTKTATGSTSDLAARPPGEREGPGRGPGGNRLGPANQGGRKPPKPVTITDQATVRKLTALVNGLALFPPGAFNCPADFGGNLVLTFRAGPRAPALAVATADLSGCDGVDLTIGGKPQPPWPPGHRQRPPDPEDRRPVLADPCPLRPAD